MVALARDAEAHREGMGTAETIQFFLNYFLKKKQKTKTTSENKTIVFVPSSALMEKDRSRQAQVYFQATQNKGCQSRLTR